MISFIYECIYTLIPALTAMYYYCGLTGMEKPGIAMFAVVIITALMLPLFMHLKSSGRLLYIGIALANAVALYLLYIRDPESFALINIPWLGHIILIGLISYAAGFLLSHFSPARYICMIGCITLLVLTMLRYIAVKKPGVFFCMMLILTALADEVQIHWKRAGYTDKKKHLVSLLPFMAVLIISTSLIKYPSKPYDWKFFINLWDKMVVATEKIRFAFESSTDSDIGFSDNGTLLSDLNTSKREVLSVTVNDEFDRPLYLAGSTFNSFDGHSWKNTNKTSMPERTLDTIESIASAYCADSVFSDFYVVRDYYLRRDLSLKYLDTKSKYLFAPAKLNTIKSLHTTSAKEKNGALMFRLSNRYHLNAELTYYMSNENNIAFYDHIKSDPPPTESEWQKALVAVGLMPNDDEFTFSLYEKYKEHIKDTYTESVTLSPALKDKLDTLFRGTDSQYEKLKRLEYSLGQMGYDLAPPVIPQDVKTSSQYLDFFLLQSGRGYCSYYATAFVLIARSMGLPARYVQGYRVYIKDKGTYKISSNMAHAWPEVYFEGKGWIAFEPTPGFYSDSSWITYDQRMSEGQETMHVPAVFDRPAITPVPKDQPEEEEPEDKEEGRIISVTPAMILIPVSIAVAFLILFLFTAKVIKRRRFRLLDIRQKYIYLSRESLQICRSMGLGIKEGETLSEFRDRIVKETGDANLSFITGYEMLLYSDKMPDDPGLRAAFDCRNGLLLLLRQKKRLRYILTILLN